MATWPETTALFATKASGATETGTAWLLMTDFALFTEKRERERERERRTLLAKAIVALQTRTKLLECLSRLANTGAEAIEQRRHGWSCCCC